MMAKRVLIVDDDPMIRQMLRDILEITGYTVVEASDGAEALDNAEVLHPDIILLDLMMPGMDGYTACRELKANPMTRAIPVIFVTASEDVALNRLAFAAGAVACVPKPFRREALTAIIETILASVARRARPAKECASPNRDVHAAAPLPA